MPNVVVGLRTVGSEVGGVTDASGAATLSFPDGGHELAVIAVDSFDLLDTPDDIIAQLRSIANAREFVRPLEQLLRLSPAVNDYSVQLRFRIGEQLHGFVVESGAPATRTWELSTPTSGMASPATEEQGAFQFVSEPIAEDVLIAMYTDEILLHGRERIFRIPASQIIAGDLGSIVVDDLNPDIGRVQFGFTAGPAAWNEVAIAFDQPFWGLALVSSDGRNVMSFFSQSDLRLANEPATIPVGTYYVVPGGIFCWTWTQRRIVEACLNGVDLTQSNIPRIVVTEGMNANIDFDPVAAELAIQQFFLPPN